MTGEPVARVLAGQWVGAVAQIAAVQVGRQGAPHGETGRAVFLGDRGEAALEIQGKSCLVGHRALLVPLVR
ncbi:hypothetical protein [Streptomyces phaeochromogenes]